MIRRILFGIAYVTVWFAVLAIGIGLIFLAIYLAHWYSYFGLLGGIIILVIYLGCIVGIMEGAE